MSYLDDTVIRMRKENAYIITILKWVVKQQPLLDEIVSLARVLSILDDAGMAISRTEVRTAFNSFYHKEFHGDKQSYLAWLYKEFHVKAGTKVHSSNYRSQNKNKTSVTRTRSENSRVISQENQSLVQTPTKPLQEVKNG